MATTYLEDSQQLKRSTIRSGWLDFWEEIYVLKHWFHKVAKCMKRSKLELHLNIEFGALVLFILFIGRKSFGTAYSFHD